MRKYFFLLTCFVLISLSMSSNTQVSATNLPENNDMIFNILNSNVSLYNITNNNDLQTKSLSGNGSEADPYILGNFIINTCSIDYTGIDIQNTDLFFILTNVTVNDCNTGIQLTNVTHGSITNSHIYSTSNTGIFLNSTRNSSLINNFITTSANGIILTNSNFNTIANNSALLMSEVYYSLSNSSNNLILNNSVSNVNDFSIGFKFNSSSNYNYLGQSNVTIPNGIGFSIASCQNNSLEDNYVINSDIGFNLQYVSNTSIISNTITNSGTFSSMSTAINILNSTNCNVSANSVFGTFFGYNFTYSDYNNVSFNKASLVAGFNFFLLESDFNYLTNNTVIYLNQPILGGFMLKNSNNNTLANNSVNTIGGQEYIVDTSSFNLLQGNSAINSQNSCFELVNASYNTLIDNTAQTCSVGISLTNSNNNTLENNSVTFGTYGFLLTSSSYNTITGNYGANNTNSDYQDNTNATNTVFGNSFNSNNRLSTNSSTSSSQPPLPPSMFGGIGWNINFPELAMIAFLIFIPFVGFFLYSKLSGSKQVTGNLNVVNDFSFKEKHYLSLFFLGPIITLFATIYYSNKHRNLDYFDLKSNEIRGKILTVLDEQNFIHFNKLKEILGCGVSILKWHIQVLHEFNIVNWEKIGQYKVIYLVEKPPAIKEVNLFYSLTNDKVIMILEQFMKINTWKIDNLANKSFLRKDSVLHHCKKLSLINILKENPHTHEFSMPPDSKEIVKKILFKRVYYSSKKRLNVPF